MEVPAGPLGTMFWKHVPRQYMKNVTRYLIDAYELSHGRAKSDFPPAVAQNYRPFRKRALIETQLIEMATAFPRQINAEFKKDSGSGFWNHALIVCEKKVALTQCTAPDPEHVVRHSHCREQYAVHNGQKSLFEDDRPKRKSDSMLYGIIQHGRDLSSAARLGFAVIRFPQPDLTSYYSEKINLLREFPDVAAFLNSRPADGGDQEDVGDLPDIDFNEEEGIG